MLRFVVRPLVVVTICALSCSFGLMQQIVAAPPTAELPLRRIVLYNTGVGFFERSGEIEGDKQVELKFNVEDVNDILKSMILRDLGDGQITHVTYDSPDPITRTLQTFSIDLARNPTLSDLLKQIRGEKVQVMTPNAVVGVIVGVERRRQPLGKDQQLVDVDTLLLKTETGLRGIPMTNITETKILNEKLDKEFQDALGILAAAHANDKKTVVLNFSGKGKRPVKVGYIQEAPVWKTTYRLAIDEKDSALLQGWAIVENTTEQDWKDVNVTLVSGRPVSFQMDLYQPLFADRPVVVPETFANLVPRVHDEDLGPAAGKIGGFGGLGGNANGNNGFGNGGQQQPSNFGGGGAGALGGAGANAGDQKPKVTSVIPVTDGKAPDKSDKKDDDSLDLKKGITTAAEGSEMGELFRYSVKLPVSLVREKAALLPIVNEPVKATKLSLYNVDVHPKHPMHALKLVNNTKLRLMQGPITVFDAGEYAGDAQVETIAPGGERLVTYALDLDVEIIGTAMPQTDKITEVYIAKGTMHSKRAQTAEQRFALKNTSEKAKKVMIEFPRNLRWKLVEPKEAAEKTRDLYRFVVDVPANKTENFKIIETRDVWDKSSVNDLKPETIAAWLDGAGHEDAAGDPRLLAVGPAVRAAISDMQKRRKAIDDIEAKHKSLDLDVSDIKDEQSRIRLNMGTLDKNSELFHRYEKTFNEQEDKLIKLRPELKTVILDEAKLKREFNNFMNELSVKEKDVGEKPAEKK